MNTTDKEVKVVLEIPVVKKEDITINAYGEAVEVTCNKSVIGYKVVLLLCSVCQRRKKRRQWFLIGTNSHKICRPANSEAILKRQLITPRFRAGTKKPVPKITDALAISAFRSSFDVATA